MSTKTDNAADVGKHKFELAGLGKAPFRFIGMAENVITYPDGTQQAGGTCDYCGTGIRYEFSIRSSDGQCSKVGCNCIGKVGDSGLMKAYKSSPEFRAIQAKKRSEKAAAVHAELVNILATKTDVLAALPHPQGFTDRATGAPLTALDQLKWYFNNAGASGRESALKWVKRTLSSSALVLA